MNSAWPSQKQALPRRVRFLGFLLCSVSVNFLESWRMASQSDWPPAAQWPSLIDPSSSSTSRIFCDGFRTRVIVNPGDGGVLFTHGPLKTEQSRKFIE